MIVENSDESVYSDSDSEILFEELPNIEHTSCFEKENLTESTRPRKRMRNNQAHKSSIAKDRVERGLERKTKNGEKTISAKIFNAQIICKCLDHKKQKLSCSHKIEVVRQKQIFDSYYQQMSWTQKTLFIRGHVKRQPVKTKRSRNFPLINLKNQNFNHLYTLSDENGIEHEVCKNFFMNCLQITSYRIYNALNTRVLIQAHQRPVGSLHRKIRQVNL